MSPKVIASVYHLRCYTFIMPILDYCSPFGGSPVNCHLQLLEFYAYGCQAFSDLCLKTLNHHRCVAGLRMNIVLSELSPACRQEDLLVLLSQYIYTSLRFSCVGDHNFQELCPKNSGFPRSVCGMISLVLRFILAS